MGKRYVLEIMEFKMHEHYESEGPISRGEIGVYVFLSIIFFPILLMCWLILKFFEGLGALKNQKIIEVKDEQRRSPETYY